MIYYKNLSVAPHTFYGVEFKPGEIKAVPGFINHSKFMRIDVDTSPEPSPPEMLVSKPVKLKVGATRSVSSNTHAATAKLKASTILKIRTD